jgi:hypothetical protein
MRPKRGGKERRVNDRNLKGEADLSRPSWIDTYLAFPTRHLRPTHALAEVRMRWTRSLFELNVELGAEGEGTKSEQCERWNCLIGPSLKRVGQMRQNA